MFDEKLPIATLPGTNSESLTIQIWRKYFEDPDLEFRVYLKSPETNPPIEQLVETYAYDFRGATDLTKLLDGDSTVRFGLRARYFDLQIYEHTWGVHYGFIAETTISTIEGEKFSPWPIRRKIGDYLLDRDPSAGCLKFAFVCEYEPLRAFAKQLDIMHREIPHEIN